MEELKDVFITEKSEYLKEYSIVENSMSYKINSTNIRKSNNKRWKIYFNPNGLEIKTSIIDDKQNEKPIQITNYLFY